MFTGIVQGKAVVETVKGTTELKTFLIRFPSEKLVGISQGASIAINGTCLTVTGFDLDKGIASFDVMKETLDKTNLPTLIPGQTVNFERAAKIGDEIGGHLMSGHVYTTTTVKRIEKTDDRCTIYFSTPASIRPYLLPKGFVGLNGCSLTLGDVNENEFNVHLIPETLNVTTFGDITEQSQVNIEVDPQTQAIVDTVERVLSLKSTK